jgi:hypothetical protein
MAVRAERPVFWVPHKPLEQAVDRVDDGGRGGVDRRDHVQDAVAYQRVVVNARVLVEEDADQVLRRIKLRATLRGEVMLLGREDELVQVCALGGEAIDQ